MKTLKKSSTSKSQGKYIGTVYLQSLEIGFGYAQYKNVEQIENKFVKELKRLK